MSLRTGQRLNRQAWTVLPMPDTVVSTVHSLAKTKIIGLPFHNRKKELIDNAVTDENPNSTGVIEDDTAETDESDYETDYDDDDDDNDMPDLQERDLYDSDSDDEEEEEEEEEEENNYEDYDNEQSAGVLNDESAGVEVETVEEEETVDEDEAEVPNVRTRGAPTHQTRTRTRRVKQTHLNSDFVYTNYSSSLTHSQSHITRTIEHVHAMHALVNYGQVMSPGIKNVVMGLAMAQQYHVNKGLKVFGERGREAVMKEMKQLD
jgi:hypothetical protein